MNTPKDQRDPSQKITDGDLPFRAEASSTNGSPIGMKVSYAEITINGKKQVVVDEELELSLNKIDGDKSQTSSAVLSALMTRTGVGKATIRTTNNASVLNTHEPCKIEFPKSRIEPRGPNGEFATIRLQHQGDGSCDYLDVVTGEKGDAHDEKCHITFYFDGNGKCIFQRKHKITIESRLLYESETSSIVPSMLKITFEDLAVSLVLSFDYSPEDKLVRLTQAVFE